MRDWAVFSKLLTARMLPSFLAWALLAAFVCEGPALARHKKASTTAGQPAEAKHRALKRAHRRASQAGSQADAPVGKGKSHKTVPKSSGKPAAPGKKTARHRSVPKGNSDQLESATAARKGRHHRHAGEDTADKSLEPKEMPPNYEVETRLLSKAYRLRDQAHNEQMRGDYGDAVKHLGEAAEISGQYYQGEPAAAEAQLYLELGEAAEAAGQDDLACRSYRDCIARNPTLPAVHVQLAILLAKLGDADNALAEAQKASTVDPYDPRAHHLLSLLLERKGDLTLADAERAKATSLLKAGPKLKPAAPLHLPEPAEELQPDSAQDGNEPQGGNPLKDMPLGLP